MEHYRQHSVMFHRLMETVCDDIVSQLSVFIKRTFVESLRSRLKDLIDQVYVRLS